VNHTEGAYNLAVSRLMPRYHLQPVRFYADSAFGVQLFFVISGFVMAHVMWNRFGKVASVRDFALNRVTRIVPLYWALILLMIPIALVGVHTGSQSWVQSFSWLNVAKSLFFIPYAAPITPLSLLGWTLNFEMMFYVLMTGALIFPRRVALPLLLIALAGASIVLTRLLANVHYPIPIAYGLSEFGIGLIIAAVWNSGFRIPDFPGRLVLVILILIVDNLLFNRTLGSVWGLIFAGPVIALAVLSSDISGRGKLQRFVIAGGNASYSLYLIHGLVMEMMNLSGYALNSPHMPTLPAPLATTLFAIMGLVTVVSSVAAAFLCYAGFERPVTAWLRGRQGRAWAKQTSPGGL